MEGPAMLLQTFLARANDEAHQESFRAALVNRFWALKHLILERNHAHNSCSVVRKDSRFLCRIPGKPRAGVCHRSGSTVHRTVPEPCGHILDRGERTFQSRSLFFHLFCSRVAAPFWGTVLSGLRSFMFKTAAPESITVRLCQSCTG